MLNQRHVKIDEKTDTLTRQFSPLCLCALVAEITKRLATTLILAYQYSISPLLLPSCRFTPTCSEYAKQAIERYGLWHGTRLGLLRLLRCHPFHPGGYDPL